MYTENSLKEELLLNELDKDIPLTLANKISKYTVDKLLKKGVLEKYQKEVYRINDESIEVSDKRELTSDQEKSLSEIINDLKNIERDLSKDNYIDAPESLNLTKIDVPTKSEDELEALAKNSLNKKYGDKKTSTNDSFEKQIQNLISSKETLKDNASIKQNNINKIYDKGIKETESQMLKRGLARSSIVIGELSALEGDRANELAEILQDLETKLSSTEANISSLEKQKDDALASLDIEYAIELEEEISKVKDDYNKARNDAIEFNNNIDKLEAEYKLKLDEQKTEKKKELNQLKDKYGTDYTAMLIKEKQFDYLKSYFSSLEPNYAFNLFLTNKEFQNILGDRYTEMYQYLRER